MLGYTDTVQPLKHKINNTDEKELWPLAKCCKYEAFCWRHKSHVCALLSGSKSYKVVTSSKKAPFVFSGAVHLCLCILAELHYPDKLLWKGSSWILWDTDWGDDPVSLHAFELAVCVSRWKLYFLPILGYDWNVSNVLNLWKWNNFENSKSRLWWGYIWGCSIMATTIMKINVVHTDITKI